MKTCTLVPAIAIAASALTSAQTIAQNVPGFENLTNLDQLPVRGALLIALPMKIEGGSGGPLRAIALVPRQ
jgi:kynurenine formamidase